MPRERIQRRGGIVIRYIVNIGRRPDSLKKIQPRPDNRCAANLTAWVVSSRHLHGLTKQQSLS
jgi:hypothetical protein